MATSGGQPGNQSAKKAKVYEQALKRALARFSGESVDAGLDRVADRAVAAACAGEQWAIIHVSDRLDGKAAQSLDANIDAGSGLLGILDGLRKAANPPMA